MKVFTNTEFSGHWPVGTAAVVVAADADAAAFLLEKQLAKQGLSQKIKATEMVEIDLTTQGVTVLRDGDY
jgi:hypothetical protein